MITYLRAMKTDHGTLRLLTLLPLFFLPLLPPGLEPKTVAIYLIVCNTFGVFFNTDLKTVLFAGL